MTFIEHSLAVNTVLQAFKPFITNRFININKIGTDIPLPQFSESTITALCDETITLLQKRPSLLKIDPPLYIVGDIHGNILDLIRIFILAQTPPKSRFLFLGDYVDRGPCSLCVICLLYAMQLAYPDHVYLIRGNHEFESINSTYGFQDEVLFFFGTNDLFLTINKTFEYLPIAAVIKNQMFCVHGGLSPTLHSLAQIESIQRPFKTYESDFVADLLWSDPVQSNTTYVRSNRGSGVTFGPNEVQKFMEEFKMKTIIRAHQCVKSGILKFSDTELYTVFSSSNYDDGAKNSCGLIFVQPDLSMQFFSFPPVNQLIRETAIFEDYVYVKPIVHEEKKSSRPVTFNVKLNELSRMPHSSLGIKVKSVGGYDSMFGAIQQSASFDSVLPPLMQKSK